MTEKELQEIKQEGPHIIVERMLVSYWRAHEANRKCCVEDYKAYTEQWRVREDIIIKRLSKSALPPREFWEGL
jgi:hypothetical protein